MSTHKVVIFGATGRTGSACVDVALKNGLTVTAFVRNPKRVVQSDVSIVTGDVTNPEHVQNAVSGQDAVIVALGTGEDLSATTVLSECLANVLTAMRHAELKRIVVCNSGFMFWSKEKIPARFKEVSLDHERQLRILSEASDIDWIAVCPPHIADEPATGDYIVALNRNVSSKISKLDLADLIVKCLSADGDKYVRQTIGVAMASPSPST